MSRGRIIILLIAAGSAILAALLARSMMNQPQTATPVVVAAPPQIGSQVLVATKDIVRGESINALAVEWRDWPRENISTDMISKDARPDAITEIEGSRARFPIIIGEPISDRKIVMAKDRGLMSAFLPEGMRAIAMAISNRSAASGFILPNDRVDVLQTIKRSIKGKNGGPDQTVVDSRTLLTNVRVLAINQTVTPDGDKPTLPDLETAVLELFPDQAELIARSEALGELTLTIRSLAEDAQTGPLQPVISESFGPRFVRYGIEAATNNR